MEDFKRVDVLTYVKEGIENGTMVPKTAEKFARIAARQGTVGESVISWTVDSEGNEVEEKVDKVELDPETGEPGWIVTKVDDNGEVIIDNNNHPNQWIISDSVFRKKYEQDLTNPGVFKPKGGPQLFVKITENITLNQWGKDENIAAGGYINITDPNDMYGISQRDFEDTYRFVEKSDSLEHETSEKKL